MTMPTGTPAAIQRLVEATNAADSAAFLESFTADGVVDDWGREFAGQEEIADWNDRENTGVHSQFTLHRVIKDGRRDEERLGAGVTPSRCC
jgi:hypothetical protein